MPAPGQAQPQDVVLSGKVCSDCNKEIPITETFSRVGKKILCTECYAKEFGLTTKKSGDPILDEIGLNIPGLVVLKGKEERYIGRLLQDQTARETHRSGEGGRKRGDLPGEKRLMDFLFKKGVLGEADIGPVRSHQAGNQCSLLASVVAIEKSTPTDLGNLLADETGQVFSTVDVLEIDENVFSLINHDTIRSYEVVPLSKTDDALTVAIANPLDKEAIDEYGKITGLEINAVICTESCALQTIAKYFPVPQ